MFGLSSRVEFLGSGPENQPNPLCQNQSSPSGITSGLVLEVTGGVTRCCGTLSCSSALC